MKRFYLLISLVLILFLLLSSAGFSSEQVDIKTAKKSAEYHGELIFEKDLKICDWELMYWPSGEPAVYVFTLIKAEGDFYPENVMMDNTLLLGAYLVSTGEELEGYTLMAQAERYMTVYVGATTDMSPFIKAHAGLPEHILISATMENLPSEPHWIYGGLFHTLVCSKAEKDWGESMATEIHLRESVALKDLGIEKTGTIPSYEEELEWEPFLRSDKHSYLMNVKGKKKEKILLKVDEINNRGEWVGCSPAAFVNCLRYLEKKRKLIKTGGKSIDKLLLWTAACYRTSPYNKKTKKGGVSALAWIPYGSNLMFKGLGYESDVSVYKRKNNNPLEFINKFIKELEEKFPCNLGSGKGIFNGHSTTGIGYEKNGDSYMLIVHDGWTSTPNEPVIVKYYGYPNKDIEYPQYMRCFRPGKKKKFPQAELHISVPASVQLTNNQWRWGARFSSNNAIDLECWAVHTEYYDNNGKKYKETDDEDFRLRPYKKYIKYKNKKPAYKKGKAKTLYYLIDYNGHWLELNYTVDLIEDNKTVERGKWAVFYKHYTWGDFQEKQWEIQEDGDIYDSWQGPDGKWTISGSEFTAQFQYQRYIGTISTDKKMINGSWYGIKWPTTDVWEYAGTWNATWKSY